jgi:hypothetical protein
MLICRSVRLIAIAGRLRPARPRRDKKPWDAATVEDVGCSLCITAVNTCHSP